MLVVWVVTKHILSVKYRTRKLFMGVVKEGETVAHEIHVLNCYRLLSNIFSIRNSVHVIPPLVINTTTHNNKSVIIGETKHLYNQLPVTKWMSVNSESVNKHYYIIMPLFLTFRKTIMMIYVEVTSGNKSHVYKNHQYQ